MFFFFNDTATTEIYTLSLHDALPICGHCRKGGRALTITPEPVLSLYEGGPGPGGGADPVDGAGSAAAVGGVGMGGPRDRKSTRLNSSHANISYAVFCLKKKKISKSNN